MIELLIFLFMFVSVSLFGIRRLSIQSSRMALYEQSLRGVFDIPQKGRDILGQLKRDLDRFANFLERPEWASFAWRSGQLLSALVLAVAVLSQWFYLAAAAPFAFFAPYLVLRDMYRTRWFKLKRQLRKARLLMAYLSKAGAPADQALLILSRATDAPLRPHLEDVCRSVGAGQRNGIRVQTVAEALGQMAEKINTPEMTQFAQLLMQAQKYNTPLAETLQHSLQVENKNRDANAEEVYGRAQSKISLMMAALVAAPTFFFMIFAAVCYFLKVLGGGLGGVMG